jgi:putative aminopeptidase FrvX
MPDEQFGFMRRIISAPSPVGLEASMTQGVIAPEFESFGAVELGWREHKFRGNAGTVWDTGPCASEEPSLTVMICGHADKIRMQVRSISADGKVWIQSDSFLPLTLLGNQVTLFSEDPAALGTYRQLQGTIEALGAIHFAPPESRSGKKGIGPEEVYLELGLHGSQRKEQLDQLGVRPGDTILLNRPIERCLGGDTFSGAYLDNGLGCFVAAEVARKIAASPDLTKHCRCLFAFASHEEIGAAEITCDSCWFTGADESSLLPFAFALQVALAQECWRKNSDQTC